MGTSGLVVDMAALALLADPRFLGWNVLLSKIIAAEIAMTNNFIWNELWTFAPSPLLKSEIQDVRSSKGILRRFLTFNAICGVGIGIAVFLLHFFHSLLEWDLYVANLTAIIVVTFWNFSMNCYFNWNARHH